MYPVPASSLEENQVLRYHLYSVHQFENAGRFPECYIFLRFQVQPNGLVLISTTIEI